MRQSQAGEDFYVMSMISEFVTQVRQRLADFAAEVEKASDKSESHFQSGASALMRSLYKPSVLHKSTSQPSSMLHRSTSQQHLESTKSEGDAQSVTEMLSESTKSRRRVQSKKEKMLSDLYLLAGLTDVALDQLNETMETY